MSMTVHYYEDDAATKLLAKAETPDHNNNEVVDDADFATAVYRKADGTEISYAEWQDLVKDNAKKVKVVYSTGDETSAAKFKLSDWTSKYRRFHSIQIHWPSIAELEEIDPSVKGAYAKAKKGVQVDHPLVYLYFKLKEGGVSQDYSWNVERPEGHTDFKRFPAKLTRDAIREGLENRDKGLARALDELAGNPNAEISIRYGLPEATASLYEVWNKSESKETDEADGAKAGSEAEGDVEGETSVGDDDWEKVIDYSFTDPVARQQMDESKERLRALEKDIRKLIQMIIQNLGDLEDVVRALALDGFKDELRALLMGTDQIKHSASFDQWIKKYEKARDEFLKKLDAIKGTDKGGEYTKFQKIQEKLRIINEKIQKIYEVKREMVQNYRDVLSRAQGFRQEATAIGERYNAGKVRQAQS